MTNSQNQKINKSISLRFYLGFAQNTGKLRLQQEQLLQRKAPEAKPFAGVCEESNGRYTVAGQCDAYVECQRGVPEEKLCPDGLLFNDKVELFTYPCQYPVDVDCSTRAKLQSPQVPIRFI